VFLKTMLQTLSAAKGPFTLSTASHRTLQPELGKPASTPTCVRPLVDPDQLAWRAAPRYTIPDRRTPAVNNEQGARQSKGKSDIPTAASRCLEVGSGAAGPSRNKTQSGKRSVAQLFAATVSRIYDSRDRAVQFVKQSHSVAKTDRRFAADERGPLD